MKKKSKEVSGYNWADMAKKLNHDQSKPINPNDPYGDIKEFDLNEYDRRVTDAARKMQESNPLGAKSKRLD